MGLLDNYQAFSGMNPEAYRIANEMASYMDTISNKQKQEYANMMLNSYAPASQAVQNVVAPAKEPTQFELMMQNPIYANNKFLKRPDISNLANSFNGSGAK